MRDLGMELHSKNGLGFVPESGNRRVRTSSHQPIVRWQRPHLVAVAHPHRDTFVLCESGKDSRRVIDLELGPPILASLPEGDHAPLEMSDQVHPVADAEHWRDVQESRIGGWDALPVDGVGATTQDNAGWPPLAHPIDRFR